MDNQNEIPGRNDDSSFVESGGYDYSVVTNPVRIAIYDDGHSIPRMVVVPPSDTAEFIESLAQTVYREARDAGGSLPYTIIREVSENFIHARFAEATVSILDRGNTIRFTDQGPGIPDKERAQQPGFTRAVEPMKRYIRGVGSGLPIVREYLELSHGRVTIEDNLGTGAVVTISLSDGGHQPASPASSNLSSYSTGSPFSEQTVGEGYYGQGQPAYPGFPSDGSSQPSYGAAPSAQQSYPPLQQGMHPYGAVPASGSVPVPSIGGYAGMPFSQAPVSGYQGYDPLPGSSGTVPARGAAPEYPQRTVFPGSLSVSVPDLSVRELDVLALLYREGPLRTKDLSERLQLAGSSVNSAFTKLESKGLVQKLDDRSRVLTEIGKHVASNAL